MFAVAVAKRGTLDLQRLKGVRSCHNGARWTSGWNIPMGFLLARSDLMWVSGQPLSHGEWTRVAPLNLGLLLLRYLILIDEW